MDRRSTRNAHKKPDQRQRGTDKVVLLRWRNGGEIIALFLELPATTDGLVTSYQHVGQHGAADYQRVLSRTAPVPLDGPDRERDELLGELISMGYHPAPRRRTPRRWRKR